MKALLKFVGVKNRDTMIHNETSLSPVIQDKIRSMAFNGLGAYLDVLINNPEFNAVSADYSVIKTLNQGDGITFSNYRNDWYDEENHFISNWFQVIPDNLNFYTLDLLCEVSYKSIIGNYYVLSLVVVDVGYITSRP